jgi:glucose/arabinose dehydrogenase
MVIYNQGKFLLLTIGSYGTVSGVQDDKTTFGKIVSIDIKSKQYSIISTGHRNPQGLIYLPDEDVILSTEHGPKGGDELNKIKAGKNYGWPVSSYGIIYNDNLTEWGPKYNSHKDHGFEEPIHYFVPSIGISQIIKVPGAFSEKWANNILITSLTGSTPYGNHSHDSHNIISDTAGYSIYRAVLNEKYDKLISLERILLGERIRDIIYEKDNNVFLMILENSPSLGVLSVKK